MILGDTGCFIICVSFLRIMGVGINGACFRLNVMGTLSSALTPSFCVPTVLHVTSVSPGLSPLNPRHVLCLVNKRPSLYPRHSITTLLVHRKLPWHQHESRDSYSYQVYKPLLGAPIPSRSNIIRLHVCGNSSVVYFGQLSSSRLRAAVILRSVASMKKMHKSKMWSDV